MELIISSHQETSGYSRESLDVFLANTFLDVMKLTTRTQCSLMFSCKLSFQIVDFKHIFSSLNLSELNVFHLEVLSKVILGYYM